MKFFTKKETKAVALIFLAIVLVSIGNFRVSLRRSRDATRKSDLGYLHGALAEYQKDYGAFPLSDSEGRILACLSPDKVAGEAQKIKDDPTLKVDFEPCEWGNDSLSDVFDASYPSYVKNLPDDPQKGDGATYFYISNGSRFQVFATLEGADEDEYDEKIIARNLMCGNQICNFGRAYSSTPLDITIEEYERQLNEAKK